MQYYLLVRSLLRTQPHLRRCLTRCRHCRIFFLTVPCNAGRTDLGCPFGCGQAHRRQQSTDRSNAYYRSDTGRKKKRDLNQRRPAAYRPAPAPAALPKPAPDPAVRSPWPGPVVAHVRQVVSWIEHRVVRREEILRMLAQVLRQQGLGRRRRIDYALAWLNEHPP